MLLVWLLLLLLLLFAVAMVLVVMRTKYPHLYGQEVIVVGCGDGFVLAGDGW